MASTFRLAAGMHVIRAAHCQTRGLPGSFLPSKCACTSVEARFKFRLGNWSTRRLMKRSRTCSPCNKTTLFKGMKNVGAGDAALAQGQLACPLWGWRGQWQWQCQDQDVSEGIKIPPQAPVIGGHDRPL